MKLIQSQNFSADSHSPFWILLRRSAGAFALLAFLGNAQATQFCSFSILKNQGDESNPDYRVLTSRVIQSQTGEITQGFRSGLLKELNDSELAYEFQSSAAPGHEMVEVSLYRVSSPLLHLRKTGTRQRQRLPVTPTLQRNLSSLRPERTLLGTAHVIPSADARTAQLDSIDDFEVLTTCFAPGEAH